MPGRTVAVSATGFAAMISTASVYDREVKGGGFRILIMRGWPRWVRKSEIDGRIPDAAPSRDLLNVYRDGHITWDAFVDRYRNEMGSLVLNNLRTSNQGIGAIRAYFAAVIDHLSSARGKAGCLMVNTLVEQTALDDEVGECVMRNVKALEEAFRLAVERGQDLGEIDSDRTSKQLAEYLTTNAIGLNVLGKAHRSRKRLAGNVEIMLKALE